MPTIESNEITPSCPVGIKPEWIWLDARIASLQAAIERYEEAIGEVPHTSPWLEELERHKASRDLITPPPRRLG